MFWGFFLQIRERILNDYENLKVVETEFKNDKIRGWYERNKNIPNGLIILNENEDYYRQNGILAEEIGHHETSYGKITNVYTKEYNVKSARQELRARRYGYKLMLPLHKLINCYKKHIWGDLYEICLHLGVDREYFRQIIEDYKSQFGLYVEIDGYRIEFEPLNIYKI